MEFETIKKDNRKKWIIGAVVVLAIASVVFFVATRANYKTTQRLNLINKTVNWNPTDLEIVSIKLKDGDSYKDTNTVPTSGYTLSNNSYCEVNGNKDESITMEYKDGKVTIGIGKKGTKCYLFFDKTNLKEMILADNGGESAIKAKGNPDFSKTSCAPGTYNGTQQTCEENTTGMWAMEDDYGMSYYFRGTPTNNYVKFGGFYWRIIRINGDGSIRLIYDGTEYHPNGTSTTNSIAVSSPTFNKNYNYNNYVGYTYIDPAKYVDGGQSATAESLNRTPRDNNTYATAYTFDSETGTYTLSGEIKEGQPMGKEGLYTCPNFSNSCSWLYKVKSYDSYSGSGEAYTFNAVLNDGSPISSNAKTQLDNWYTSSGLSNYANYLADSGFCGDRTSTTTSGGKPNNTGGTGTTVTYYGAYYRLVTAKDPTLKCSTISYGSGYESGSKSDVYTVSSSNGNGELQYPIGLISADEISMAGGKITDGNYAYYLYNGQTYWGMSPSCFDGQGESLAFVWSIDSYGYLYDGSRYGDSIISSRGLRPVINLDPTKINNVTTDSQGVYVVS